MFENLPKRRIQHCVRSELRLHIWWTKVDKKCRKMVKIEKSKCDILCNFQTLWVRVGNWKVMETDFHLVCMSHDFAAVSFCWFLLWYVYSNFSLGSQQSFGKQQLFTPITQCSLRLHYSYYYEIAYISGLQPNSWFLARKIQFFFWNFQAKMDKVVAKIEQKKRLFSILSQNWTCIIY